MSLSSEARRVPGTAVEVTGVSKRFGATQALRDVSFVVQEGETHALVGRNGAGKSTLVSLLTGLHAPDNGRIMLQGEPAPGPGEREAWQQRVACVYQRPSLVPTLSVAENVMLNRGEVRNGPIVRWRRLRERARQILTDWEIDVEPDTDASELDVEQRQLVEIARALSRGSRLLILDEPTAQLEARAIERLFDRLRSLRERGVTAIYISHHLDEIYELCQRVTVLRDGRHITTVPSSELPKPELVTAMVGQRPQAEGTGRSSSVQPDAEPVAQINDLSLEGSFSDVSITVQRGECLGLAGLVGSGKNAVADVLVGLRAPDSGEVRVDGAVLRPGAVDRAIAAGVGFVPEDRYFSGFVPSMGVEENLTLSSLPRLGRAGFVAPRARRQAADQLVDRLQVVASSSAQPVGELSGGNQQKVVMGRALATDPKLLVLVHPTAGVDIASKQALFNTVRAACATGAAAIVVSDELDELAVCDRVLVMFNGRLADELGPDRHDQEVVAAMEGVSA